MVRHLYNYALAGTGETVKDHQQGHPEAAPDTQAMYAARSSGCILPTVGRTSNNRAGRIKRDPLLPITTYEIAIPAAALSSVTGMTRFSAGHTFGVGVGVRASRYRSCGPCLSGLLPSRLGAGSGRGSEGTLRCLTKPAHDWGR